MTEIKCSQTTNKMGGFSTFSGLIDHLNKSGDGQNFPPKVQREIELLSKALKKNGAPCCMFPGCKVQTARLLERHHFKPKEFGGRGTLDNALFLCRNHHKTTESLCIFPIDVHYMQKGVWHPSVNDYQDVPLKKIFERLHSLYGCHFDFSNENKVMSRFTEIARIRQAVYDRKAENQVLQARIMGWTAIMLSQPLVVLLKSKLYGEKKEGQPKKFIKVLIDDAESYSLLAEDPLLTSINLHLKAINLNGLGFFNSAKRIALMSEKSIERIKDFSMPIDMDNFKYYIKSQNAVIMAKMGYLKGLSLSKESLIYSFDKSPEQYIESICRHLQTALLLGDIDECKKTEALLIKVPKAEDSDKELQKLKTLSYLRFCQGDINNEFKYFASEAKNMAIKLNRFHSLSKMEGILKISEDIKEVKKCSIYRANLSNKASFLASLL